MEEQDFFEWFNGVERVHFITDRNTGKRRGFCYVEFASPEHAADALKFNGQQFKGNKLNMKLTDSSPQDHAKKSRGRGRRGGKKNKQQTHTPVMTPKMMATTVA